MCSLEQGVGGGGQVLKTLIYRVQHEPLPNAADARLHEDLQQAAGSRPGRLRANSRGDTPNSRTYDFPYAEEGIRPGLSPDSRADSLHGR